MGTPAENHLYQCVADALRPIHRFEREWDFDKFQKKILEYLNKGYKAASGIKDWEKLVDVFCEKFFESIWRALGEREYLDDLDLTMPVAAAIQAFNAPELQELEYMAPEMFQQHVQASCDSHNDCCRYYSWSWLVLKGVVTGKQSQKHVRANIDEARDEIVKLQPATIQQFLSMWVSGTVQRFAKVHGNPHDLLAKDTAVRLFAGMCKSGGGLPLPLVASCGGMPDEQTLWYDIEQAAEEAYGAFPGGSAAASQYGNGGGSKGGGGSFAAGLSGVGGLQLRLPGLQLAGANPMLSMMGGFGKGGMGFSPY